MLAAHLICNGYTLDQALNTIKEKRQEIDPNIGFLGQLKTLEDQITSNVEGCFDISNFLPSRNLQKEYKDVKTQSKNYNDKVTERSPVPMSITSLELFNA